MSNIHEAMVQRLNERHEQLKATERLRAQQRHKSDNGAVKYQMRDFLPNFIQKKNSIIQKLDEVVDRVVKNETVPPSEITEAIDDTVGRIEELQRSLNDASLYLTAFDLEQARLELKDLNNQFQSKREQLLPSKKFSFTRKPKPTQKKHTLLSPAKTTFDKTCPAIPENQFDSAYSVIDMKGPCTVHLPKSDVNDLTGQTIYLANLVNCTIYVRGVCGNMIARNLDQCQIYTHPVDGSVWIENCNRTDFVLACRQLRIHQTCNSRLGLHVASRPIIEDSTNLHVAPYQIQYENLLSDLSRAGLCDSINLWQEVEDFSHPNKRLTTGSPNWTILAKDEWRSLEPKN